MVARGIKHWHGRQFSKAIKVGRLALYSCVNDHHDYEQQNGSREFSLVMQVIEEVYGRLAPTSSDYRREHSSDGQDPMLVTMIGTGSKLLFPMTTT